MKNDIELGRLFEQRYELDQTLQRSYEWDVDRVINLINDIREIKFKSSGGGTCKYNIGDFITYKSNEFNDFKYICDGQQRLTSLVLVFANILHHHPSDPRNKGGLEKILNKSTIDSNGREEKVKILKLKNTDNIILNKIIESGVDGLSKEEKKSHLVKVYNKITEVFTKNMKGDELDEFYKSIYSNASFFERECESQEEAIKQFNNLNGGQQTISKSRVGIATLYGIYNEKCNSNTEIEKFLFELSNMPIEKAKDFLCLYIYYRADEGKESSIPKTIKTLYKNNPNILNDIVDFYNNIYIKFIENNDNEFMVQSSLRQAWIDLYTDKFPQIKNINEVEKNITYKKCEWGYVCNRIKFGGSGEKNLFSGLFKSFDNTNDESLPTYIEEKLKDKGVYESVEIINTYKQKKNSQGNDLFIRLLLTIEKEYKNELGIRENITHCSQPTLEHIHPQKPKNDEEYQCDETITNRFGNKTILGSEANKSLSNKSYAKKRSYYTNSPYYINNKHLAEFEQWTNETVEENEKFYFRILKKHYDLE